MTGDAFFAAGAEEYELDELGMQAHAVQWIGTAGVKGPKWARLPLLTVGMLGIQCVWSIEMGYASPYLLELGLSKSLMSLVFIAGPLSGLVVQPLVGIFADRSRSPFGRRRPFMLAGCVICVSAMILLGWSREVAGIFGGGQWLAIALAVWAIYCIDFSINAVMSTDRALVVDTLPPKEQEEGSAWAGRMLGFGSVTGFFVGNLDLVPVLPILGRTQLQILSFVTSTVLLVSHSFTSWAVSERVLLRDDRPQSESSLKSNLKSIWDNMFSLAPGIRTVCLIQFFASLGWYPILFFTTVWVSEIYKASVPIGNLDQASFEAQAVRSGARALFIQALVNIVASIGLPFLVSESGVQAEGYEALKHDDCVNNQETPPNSALWKRSRENFEHNSFASRAIAWLQSIGEIFQQRAYGLPIKGLTLVKVWWFSQFVFAAAMAGTWFVTSVRGAYMITATTGFCSALSQWAPYSLLGELILIDKSNEADHVLGPSHVYTRTSIDDRHSIDDEPSDSQNIVIHSNVSPSHTPLHSRHGSRTNLLFDVTQGRDKPSSLDLDKPQLALQSGGLSPLVIQGETPVEPPLGSTVILRHSDDFLHMSNNSSEPFHHNGNSYSSHFTSRNSTDHTSRGSTGTADKAGVILGIHNVFLVLPQFIVTFLSSIIFWWMEPGRVLPVHHPGVVPIHTNVTNADIIAEAATAATNAVARRTVELISREQMEANVSSPDAVGLIFRIGGVSAAVGGCLCWRLARRWAKTQGN
ncbi:uncharacterized protein L203_101440 [Cryptococcus depauperatus CBS 7841]|uniref:Uncharacterized protein n=1 Tax=Cryptococcus depauperatus CBS 7841 TaxID=1295531 RepID=A0A1E3IVL5_9TREE|nr:solute carrier family 45, member 1/2/4 [Cryptococcus depauperatus CBS 7841]